MISKGLGMGAKRYGAIPLRRRILAHRHGPFAGAIRVGADRDAACAAECGVHDGVLPYRRRLIYQSLRSGTACYSIIKAAVGRAVTRACRHLGIRKSIEA